MDLLYDPGDAMSAFRFHQWCVVEIETNDGLVWSWERRASATHRQSHNPTTTWRPW